MREKLEPASAEIFYTIGVNRFNKAYQLQNYLSDAEKIAAAADAEKNLLKAIEIDAIFPDAYAYMKILYINVHAKLYPEKEGRYQEEANRYGEKFTEARTRPARTDEAGERAEEDRLIPGRKRPPRVPFRPGGRKGIRF